MRKSHQPTTGPSEAEIQTAAYFLWIEGGCRHGHDAENWFAAKELLKHHHGRSGGRAGITAGVKIAPAAETSVS